jgi:FAD-dependent monooxygenase
MTALKSSPGQDPQATETGNLSETEILPENCVLVIGGGPVGLCLAMTLAYYGVKSVILERNETTTR